MKPQEPLKRHSALQTLSSEHHNSLSLCWKIQSGLTKSIEIIRIKRYADWYYRNYLNPHFEIEEKYIFTILGNKHELVKRALAEHRKIKRLFMDTTDTVKSLSRIEEVLESHIRYEERILFNKIQETASDKEMALIASEHDRINIEEEWSDPYWEDMK